MRIRKQKRRVLRNVSADEQIRAARAGWGRHLADRAWSHFATLTVDTPNTGRGGADAVRKAFARFHRRLECVAQHRVRFAYTIEGLASGNVHIHALIADCDALPVWRIRRLWTWGHSHVRVCDPVGAAAYYIAKRVGTPDGWESVECSRELPQLIESGSRDRGRVAEAAPLARDDSTRARAVAS